MANDLKTRLQLYARHGVADITWIEYKAACTEALARIEALEADNQQHRKKLQEAYALWEKADNRAEAAEAEKDHWKERTRLCSAAVEKLEAENARLREALEAMVEEKADYMRINKLGDPEQQHTIKVARAALADDAGEDKP